MSDTTNSAWRCLVCGYIHHGPEAPERCPICDAPRMDFEPHAAPPPPAPKAAARRWRCMICEYVHEGAAPPKACPLCNAAADCFEPIAQPLPRLREPRRAQRIAIAGAGIAGLAAAEAARAAAPDAEITLLAKEPGLPYYRLNLTRALAGELDAEDLPIHPTAWYREQRIELRAGAEVAALDPAAKTLELDSGERLGFDKLILACGAHAFLPPLPGVGREGVHGLRTLEDTEAILRACAGGGARCVIIGGGILGLEAAGALARRGVAVTVLEGYGWLLPRQLSRRAGELLAAHVARQGITLRPLARTRAITGDARVGGIELESGERLPADVVIVATGVRANSYLARQAGLAVGQGIIVDDQLRTSAPDVLAAGDAAEHRGVVYGLWGPAQFMGRLAGMNAAGGAAEFGGVPRSNTLKVLDIDLFSIGRIEPEDASHAVIESESGENYTRFLVRDGRLEGAILLGDTRAAGAVKRALESGTDLSGVLMKNPTAAELAGALG